MRALVAVSALDKVIYFFRKSSLHCLRRSYEKTEPDIKIISYVYMFSGENHKNKGYISHDHNARESSLTYSKHTIQGLLRDNFSFKLDGNSAEDDALSNSHLVYVVSKLPNSDYF